MGIAEVTKYPMIHLDNEYWKPNWVETPKDEWLKKHRYLISGEKWVVDGNYNSTLEQRFKACDAVIFLDINRFVCCLNAIRRHGKNRTDLHDYCNEKFNKDFLEFLKYIWLFPKTYKSNILLLHEKYEKKSFVVINSRRKANKFIEM